MNYYEILNVSPMSESIVIRAAYRALMTKYHPDKYAGSRAESDRMSRRINEAYETLGDPARRAAYDSQLAREALAQASAPGASRTNAGGPHPPPPPAAPPPADGVVEAVYSFRAAGGGFRHLWLAAAVPVTVFLAVLGSESGEAVSADVNAAAVFASENPVSSDTPTLDAVFAPPQDGWNLATSLPADAEGVAGNRMGDQGLPKDLETGLAAGEYRPSDADWAAPIGGTNARPDVSRMSSEDRSTIELACIAERGVIAKNRCLRGQADSLSLYPRPDLSRVSSEDRSTIELACIAERGVAAQNSCLRKQFDSLTPQNARPDLSRISSEDRSTIELACISKRGVVEQNRCLQAELRALLSS